MRDKSSIGSSLEFYGTGTTGTELTAAGDIEIQSGAAGYRIDVAGLSTNASFDGAFTIELFGVVRSATAAAAENGFIRFGTNGAGARGWAFMYDESTPQLEFHWTTDGTTLNSVSASQTLTASTSYNLCVERSGTTLRFYVDGTMVASGTMSGTTFSSSGLDLSICRAFNGSGTDETFQGKIRAVRITKGVARYATDTTYTVPTLPLPSVAP